MLEGSTKSMFVRERRNILSAKNVKRCFQTRMLLNTTNNLHINNWINRCQHVMNVARSLHLKETWEDTVEWFTWDWSMSVTFANVCLQGKTYYRGIRKKNTWSLYTITWTMWLNWQIWMPRIVHNVKKLSSEIVIWKDTSKLFTERVKQIKMITAVNSVGKVLHGRHL